MNDRKTDRTNRSKVVEYKKNYYGRVNNVNYKEIVNFDVNSSHQQTFMTN